MTLAVAVQSGQAEPYGGHARHRHSLRPARVNYGTRQAAPAPARRDHSRARYVNHRRGHDRAAYTRPAYGGHAYTRPVYRRHGYSVPAYSRTVIESRPVVRYVRPVQRRSVVIDGGYGYAPYGYGAYGCAPYGYGPSYGVYRTGYYRPYARPIVHAPIRTFGYRPYIHHRPARYFSRPVHYGYGRGWGFSLGLGGGHGGGFGGFSFYRGR